MFRALVALGLTLAAPVAAGDLVLGLPIDCTLGETCFIQQHVDRDPGPGARDFACGHLTYDDHKGTDFAVPSVNAMQVGVSVLSAAPGIVTATRDGMADVAYRPENAAAIEGRDCGNGIVIRHEGGWETQYCHLKNGSVRVQKGDRVARGSVLGQVGLSGRTEFPHVHLSVRHDGKVIDPFDTSAEADCGAPGTHLWSNLPEYTPGGLIASGFSDHVPGYQSVKNGTAARADMTSGSDALVLFGYAFGGLAGDRMRLQIEGPTGLITDHVQSIDRNKAQFFQAAGRRQPAGGWPAGTYKGRVALVREDKEISVQKVSITIE